MVGEGGRRGEEERGKREKWEGESKVLRIVK